MTIKVYMRRQYISILLKCHKYPWFNENKYSLLEFKRKNNVFLRIWGQIAISTLSIYTKIYHVIKKNARNLCLKFLWDNYKTLNVVNKIIIHILINQILEKYIFS